MKIEKLITKFSIEEKLRIAKPGDSEEISILVNRAYRPSADEAGWTHESNLVSGERISKEQVFSLFDGKSVILLLCEQEKIISCVHVQDGESSAYIGMLATDPSRQAQGLGKIMLQHAEKYAREVLGKLTFKMSVISSRPELLAFYERRGYTLTGETEEYPISACVGQPLIEGIQVLSLEKTIPFELNKTTITSS